LAYRRDGIAVYHPTTILVTWFGSGLLPKAPGTWGSLAALPFAYGLVWAGGPRLLLGAAALCLAVGAWFTRDYLWRTGTEDPPEVVIDEVAALWIVLVAAPLDPLFWAAGFVLFRLFDILKPWPIRWVERATPGALGVMLDDVVAAIFAVACLVGLRHALAYAGLA